MQSLGYLGRQHPAQHIRPEQVSVILSTKYEKEISHHRTFLLTIFSSYFLQDLISLLNFNPS